MSRGRVVAVAGSVVVAGALLLTTRGAADRPALPLKSGVLRVENRSCGRALLGSGFLVDRRHVVTAAHVVDDAGTITLGRGPRVVASGTLVGADQAQDVALIRLDRPVTGHVFALTQRVPKAGERVAALGYGRGAALTVARGSVRGIATTMPSPGMVRRPVIETDAPVGHGKSGGPLVSAPDGAVLGMVDLSGTSGGRPSFAVSARDFGPAIARWRRDPEAVPQRPCRAPRYPALPGFPLPAASSAAPG